MSSFFPVAKSTYSPPRKLFTDPADWGGNGPDVFATLSNALTTAQKSDPNAWQSISTPQKNLPGNSATVAIGSQRALQRTVTEPAATASAVQKAKPFDAGMISQNSGRIAVIGQLGANDSQDTYKVTLNSAGKLNLFAPNPDYNSNTPGSKISVGNAKYQVYDPSGALIATTDTRDATNFSNWISLSTDGLGGLQVAKGSYTVKITRDNPPSNISLALTAKGQLNFDGTVLDDNARLGSVISGPSPVQLASSNGTLYSASYQLVKTADGGTPSSDPNADPKAGLPGGPDTWEMQLVSLKPIDAKDPVPVDPAPSASAPVTLGTFSVSTTGSDGVTPAATFTASNASVGLVGGDSFTLSGDQVLTGSTKLSADGAHNVSDATPVNYTFFAVMGDPGATTFYTMKSQPLSPADQQKADQAAAVAAAKQSAAAGSSGSILSLFA